MRRITPYLPTILQTINGQRAASPNALITGTRTINRREGIN